METNSTGTSCLGPLAGLHGWQKGRIKDGTFEPLTRAYVEVIRDKLPKAKIIWASSTAVTVEILDFMIAAVSKYIL